MRPDNTAPIIAAARRRRELTRAKAIRALRELGHAGTPVSFEAVARLAGVSRSWLYAQPDIRAEIQRLRDATAKTAPAVPARQRATDASLRSRLETALARNRELASENQRLRRQLAYALGDRRAQPPTPGKAGPHEPIPLQ
jgi:phage tail protein X